MISHTSADLSSARRGVSGVGSATSALDKGRQVRVDVGV
jgi:hypothetical protein